MNGLSTISTYESSVDRRPIITCAGELEVFSQIEDNLSQALPEENGEFRRTLGRPVRSVHISGTFAPFSAASLPKSNQWDLIRQPVFHIYWTECTDIDVYKTNVRDDIENWMKELTNKNINDWLIVVVENYDGKRTNKLLPRTTVLDKIRADFAPKQGDRCVSVINPGKLENRSADSWKSLVSRIRHLLLMAYAKAVTRLEDYVRQQRERRNEIGWNFMEYFNLQEELAQVLEMLGLNDEALVQYDELDALFSQFVVNGITSECVNWLNNFQKPLEKWHGLKLGPSKLSTNPSILEFRSYLFAKQAHMLLLTNKVWEMTSRCLPFLHTCIREITILEITTPPGAISCWLFLASIEVLQTCDKFNHADEVEAYSLHTASLWAYASQKLRDLGELCGLMPGGTPTSEQLHIVVGLSAGMGDNPGTPNSPSPTDKLKEALCSQTVFNKTYLELAELAMGTYKHIGRLRSARLVGRELASFYMLLGETQKAASFLADALTIFEQDGWHELSAITQIELVECYKKSNNIRNLIQSSANVSAAIEIDTLIRWQYFDEMRKYLDLLEENLCVPFDKIIKIINIKLLDDTKIIMQDNYINVELIIESNFPREILCTNLVISLILDSIKEQNKSSNNIISAEMVCKGNVLSSKDLKMQDPTMRKLHIWKILDYKQDKQLALAGCAPIEKVMDLKRKDSVVGCVSTDFSYSLEANNLPFLITPGLNVLRLKKQANKIGKFHLGHIGIHIGKLQLISQQLQPKLVIEVREESPSLRLYKRAAPLVSGIEQIMNLIITMGSYSIEPKSKIKLTASTGLTFHTKLNEDLVSSLEIEIGEQPPFSSTRLALRVLADMLSKDHQICIICPWAQKPVVVSLNFASPFSTTWRLHTLEHRKFIQVNVNGQCEKDLFVEKAELNVGTVCKAVGKNFDSSQIIYNGSSFSYMWELIFPSISTNPIKAEFLISYKLDGDSGLFKNYQHFFDITDYQTLFILDAYVEPTKGNEFCRIGAVCHLNLTINSTTSSSTNEKLEQNNVPKSVMYEVLAEPSVWAVCGRTAGVISFEGDLESQTVVLDVMPLSSGYLPLPLVRISKYIPADVADKSGKVDSHPRLEPFSLGQVYNRSKDLQSFQDSWWPYSVAFIVTVISAIRCYCGGNNCTSDARIEGKHVLITGSSSGIGLETAKELAKRGGNLILAVRNIAKGQQAITTIKTHYPNAKLTLKQVDLSEFSSIRKFAKEILNEYTHIDILINNAGTISHYPSNVTTEGNSTIMATNYFGPFLLTHLLLPLLHKSENGGRVINMSALAHFTGQIHIDNLNGNLTTQELFANSKLAITMMTKYMANRFKNLTNITFNSVSPGLVRGTSHLKYSFKLENFMAKLSVWPWIWLFTKTPKQGCQSVVYLAVDPNLNDISGAYFSDCEIKEPAEILKNSSLLEKLYKKTCLIVDLKSDSVECFVN